MDSPQNPDLTALSRKLRILQPGSPEREAYLADLARQIRNGEYKIDAQRIAAKLIEEAEKHTGQQPEDRNSPEPERS